MNVSQLSTLTSGVLAIAEGVSNRSQESLEYKIINVNQENKENILVVDLESKKVSNYDEVVKSIYDKGFKVVISDVFSELFTAKAISFGILTIEVSRNFLNKIIEASKKLAFKLFIDLKGQEVMIIDSGEKEFFELSDYNKESYECGNDDFDHLYDIWGDMENLYQAEEIFDYIGE